MSAADLGTIGGLYDALRDLDPTAPVYVGNQRPTALSSYRGFYHDLAIERSDVRHERTELSGRHEPFEMNMAGYGTYCPGHQEVSIRQDPTVGDLAQALDLAIGEEFEGYKGGQYLMERTTGLWVSNHGEAEPLQVLAIEDLPDRVDLLLIEVPW